MAAPPKQAPPEEATAELVYQSIESDDSMAWLAARDINAFVEYVMRDEKTRAPIRQAPHHIRMQGMFDKSKRVAIWGFVESGKTAQAVARILFTLGKDPSSRGLVMSANDAGAKKIIDLVRDYIERSEELHRVFPNLKRGKLWTQNRITIARMSFSKDPSVQGIGLKGDVIGSRLDWAVVDDPLTLDNTQTPGRRTAVVKRIDAVLDSRLSKGAWIIALVNGWHPHDWFHRVEKHKAWLTARIPAEDKKGRLTWPERWDRARLDKKKADLVLPQEYARQMLCLARSDEDSRFKEKNILKCYRRGEGMRLISSLAELEVVKPGLWELVKEDLCFIYTGVDLAVQKHAAADETALFTILVDPKQYRWVLNITAGKMSGPEIVDLIKLTARRFRSIVRVENNAAQDYIRQFCTVEDTFPIWPHTTGSNKVHPEFGIESIHGEMAAGKWVIPNHAGDLEAEVSAWVSEMLYYDPKAHTGDRLIASWLAREQAAMVERGGTEPPELEVRVLG